MFDQARARALLTALLAFELVGGAGFFGLNAAVGKANAMMAAQSVAQYVNRDDAAAAFAASRCEDYKEGYTYLFTDPEYFHARNWTSEPIHGDRIDGVLQANLDGSLGELQYHMYCAHGDTGYGREILKMEPGDHVSVDGIEYVIEKTGHLTCGRGHTVGEVLEYTGDPDVVFQACTGAPKDDMTATSRVVWGSIVDAG